MGENGIVCFGKLVCDGAGQLDQSFATARQFVALLDFLFFLGDQICRADFVGLVAKKIKLLFAGRFSRVERSMLGEQCLQLPVLFPIFVEPFLCARERIEQAQLLLGRKQRLMIVRPMKIDKVVAEIFQDRQCGWRTVDKLTSAAGS